ncbi:Peptidase family M48 family [Cellvibrio sp. BR]|uniref:M48 family metalloprotease n=1 Tax=unclassified Cellvibrio TaxID=2624793 RepID=UPI00026015A6|nr:MULTISPECIES: M48 family metalloprotease [unclassified Cellvibrio]EIK44863.1 Peptidase family M48 family [Cellvibrio sp. BR]UUA74353.1 M48 family metalloprotease [Cellvibrio sp. QJXJ]
MSTLLKRILTLTAKRLLAPLGVASLLVSSLLINPFASHAEIELPNLGDTSSIMISPVQEKILGQRWLRAYRSQVPTSSDPLIIDYLEQLFARLLPHSQLDDKRIDLVVAQNNTLNAFAVPGNIIGVHTGLLNYAKTENQLAAVLAHEMGHLSQRHYARRLEQQKNMMMPMLAGMLAGLVLAANSNSDAGVAAIMGTQAAAQQASLAFSRQNEQEADRIGMQTMIQAGLDPHAAADMFEEMVRANRLNRRPPEYLLTHPVSETRVADARNRAMQYARKPAEDDLEFQLMRSRVRVDAEETPQIAARMFKSELDRESTYPDASRYGWALALTRSSQFDAAREALAPLLQKEPERITYQIMRADIEVAAERYKAGLEIIENQLQKHPNSHPLIIRHAEALMKAGIYQQCADILDRYSRKRSNDDYVWYLLAEVNGLAGNILGVHEARAEYFILNGVYDRAQIQLRNALKLTQGNGYRTALLEERLKYVEAQMQQQGF